MKLAIPYEFQRIWEGRLFVPKDHVGLFSKGLLQHSFIFRLSKRSSKLCNGVEHYYFSMHRVQGFYTKFYKYQSKFGKPKTTLHSEH